MADVHTQAVRARNMSAVRSCGNQSTEERFRALLRHSQIIGWRRGAKVFGKPDFVFRAQRVAVFLDGCFWHGCPRGCRNIPATNRRFWEEKIEANRRRDRVVNRSLRARGWSVIRIWEHALRADPNGVIRRLHAALIKGRGSYPLPLGQGGAMQCSAQPNLGTDPQERPRGGERRASPGNDDQH